MLVTKVFDLILGYFNSYFTIVLSEPISSSIVNKAHVNLCLILFMRVSCLFRNFLKVIYVPNEVR